MWIDAADRGSSTAASGSDALPLGERVLDRRVEGVQAHAQQLAACPRAGSRSPCRPSISAARARGPRRRSRPPRARSARQVHAQRQRGRPTSISSAMRLQHLAVAEHVRAADSSERAETGGGSARGSISITSRSSIGWVRSAARPAARAPACARPGARAAGTSASARRSRSRRAARASRRRPRAGCARPARGSRGGASARASAAPDPIAGSGSVLDQAAEVDDPPHAGAAAAAAKFSAAIALALGERRAPAGARSIEWIR